MASVVLLEREEVRLGLPLSGYRLIPGYEGELGLPVEIYLRLYAVRDAEQTLIAAPDDLTPFITRLDSDTQVWTLLRLFTDRRTHYLFQRDEYTIDLEVAAPGSAPDSGTISADVARRIGYEPPEMSRRGALYHARRDLVRANAQSLSPEATILRRTETVSETGDYRLIEDTVVASLDRQEVIVPSYE